MLSYHFTNDMRLTSLEENLYSIANYLTYDVWENNIDYESAKKGWIKLYSTYFGLYENSKNVSLILEGKGKLVIAEFVKKIQFPNPKPSKPDIAFKEQFNNGQQLAPLRYLVRLLFYKAMVEESKSTSIDISDFERFILFNPSAAKNQSNLNEIYLEMLDGTNNPSISPKFYGVGPERLATQLVGVLEKLPFIHKKNRTVTLQLDNLNSEDNEILMEIVSFNEYWTPKNDIRLENLQSYLDYMQVDYKNQLKEGDYKMDSVYNLISYGAPGTGKSHSITQKIKENYPNFEDNTSEDSKNIFRTTLHPEYTYSDFVGQIMPTITDEGPTYKFAPGVFTLSLQRAMELEDSGQPVYLVLEELSRANVAAVFGDLFQLLDRENGKSDYSISNPLIAKFINGFTDEELEDGIANTKIYLPKNLYIYATVNTNDQNVFVMDTAFKRRFEWKYVSTKPVNENNNPILSIVNSNNEKGFIKWHDLYQKLNEYITKTMKLGEDKQVGQFFIKFNANALDNKNKIQNKLLQYLWDDIEKSSLNGSNLFDKKIGNFADLYEMFAQDRLIFNEEFLSNLNDLISPPEQAEEEQTEEKAAKEQTEEQAEKEQTEEQAAKEQTEEQAVKEQTEEQVAKEQTEEQAAEEQTEEPTKGQAAELPKHSTNE